MTRARQDLGLEGEAAAARRLESQGWRILARRFRAAGHEIDLVAAREGVVALVEVKTRHAGGIAPTAAAVDWRKQRRIAAAAQVAALRWGRSARTLRFDVITVERSPNGTRLEHIENAFRLGE
jgi:putative endonuclease